MARPNTILTYARYLTSALGSFTESGQAANLTFSASSALLLDTYATGLVAAYSTRKIRTAYTGNCVRIRRSSDNTELNIGFVAGKVDTATMATFVGSNSAYVVTWFDQSGNGYNLTQATPSQQPRIVNSGSNIVLGASLEVALSFAQSSSQYLETTANAVSLGGSTLSAGGVLQHSNGAGNNERIFSFVANGQSNDYANTASRLIMGRDSNQLQLNTIVNGANRTNQWFNYTDTFQCFVTDNGSAQEIYVSDRNDLCAGSTTSGATYGSTGTLAIGRTAGQNAGYMDGKVGEMVLWSVSNAANRTNIYTDQKTYWGALV